MLPLTPFGTDPAPAAVGSKLIPAAGIREEGEAVEQVSAEGGGEEERAEAGGGFAAPVLDQLWEAGAEVE